MDEVRWIRPARPGDTLRVAVTITDSRPSSSKTDRGIVSLGWQLLNQNNELIMSMKSIQLLRRRNDS